MCLCSTASLLNNNGNNNDASLFLVSRNVQALLFKLSHPLPQPVDLSPFRFPHPLLSQFTVISVLFPLTRLPKTSCSLSAPFLSSQSYKYSLISPKLRICFSSWITSLGHCQYFLFHLFSLQISNEEKNHSVADS